MIFASQLNDPDRLVGYLAILVLSAFGVIMFVRWLLSGPAQPDPWSEEIAAAIAGDNGIPVCHRCLAAHDPMLDFCPECGAPVGTYTNWLPYPFLFSVGDALRVGTEGNFKRSPLAIAGFVLFSLADFALFAPVYWYVFLRNLFRKSSPDSPSEAPPFNPR